GSLLPHESFTFRGELLLLRGELRELGVKRGEGDLDVLAGERAGTGRADVVQVLLAQVPREAGDALALRSDLREFGRAAGLLLLELGCAGVDLLELGTWIAFRQLRGELFLELVTPVAIALQRGLGL